MSLTSYIGPLGSVTALSSLTDKLRRQDPHLVRQIFSLGGWRMLFDGLAAEWNGAPIADKIGMLICLRKHCHLLEMIKCYASSHRNYRDDIIAAIPQTLEVYRQYGYPIPIYDSISICHRNGAEIINGVPLDPGTKPYFLIHVNKYADEFIFKPSLSRPVIITNGQRYWRDAYSAAGIGEIQNGLPLRYFTGTRSNFTPHQKEIIKSNIKKWVKEHL